MATWECSLKIRFADHPGVNIWEMDPVPVVPPHDPGYEAQCEFLERHPGAVVAVASGAAALRRLRGPLGTALPEPDQQTRAFQGFAYAALLRGAGRRKR